MKNTSALPKDMYPAPRAQKKPPVKAKGDMKMPNKKAASKDCSC